MSNIGPVVVSPDIPKDWGLSWESKPKPKSPLQILWKKCAGGISCTCGVGGGFLAGHVGCVIAPSLSFAAATAGYAIATPVALGVSILSTAAGGFIWYHLRGKVAGRLEKIIMPLGLLAGLGMGVIPHIGHLQMTDEINKSLCTTPPVTSSTIPFQATPVPK